jgi:hypothetical protein
LPHRQKKKKQVAATKDFTITALTFFHKKKKGKVFLSDAYSVGEIIIFILEIYINIILYYSIK